MRIKCPYCGDDHLIEFTEVATQVRNVRVFYLRKSFRCGDIYNITTVEMESENRRSAEKAYMKLKSMSKTGGCKECSCESSYIDDTGHCDIKLKDIMLEGT